MFVLIYKKTHKKRSVKDDFFKFYQGCFVWMKKKKKLNIRENKKVNVKGKMNIKKWLKFRGKNECQRNFRKKK